MAKNESAPKTLAIGLIKGYKKLLSPLLGNNCRFNPTCSTYAIEAIDRFGVDKRLLVSKQTYIKMPPYECGRK